MEDALATFQTDKKLLAPFDSKYDKFMKNKAKLTALLQALELPMLIASHDLAFSEALADEVICL